MNNISFSVLLSFLNTQHIKASTNIKNKTFKANNKQNIIKEMGVQEEIDIFFEVLQPF